MVFFNVGCEIVYLLPTQMYDTWPNKRVDGQSSISREVGLDCIIPLPSKHAHFDIVTLGVITPWSLYLLSQACINLLNGFQDENDL